MNRPKKVLDPAAGMCEFINNVPSEEKWAVDLNDFVNKNASSEVKTVIGNIFDVDLPDNYYPDNYYDGIFMSNFLEHLASGEEVYSLFNQLKAKLNKNGHICIMGPNIKYCASEYYDCADHTLPLSHIAVEELLYSADFEIVKSYPRFLPFSFRGILPPSPLLTKLYLSLPFFWPILGKQFLVLAKKK